MEKYSWNFNEDAELWSNDSHDTIDDCIADAAAQDREYGERHDTVYIGENDPYIPRVDEESVLDALQEQAAEFAGEIGSDWDAYDYKKQNELDELSESLSAVVIEWMKKYGYAPQFYAIQSVKAYSMKGGLTMTQYDEIRERANKATPEILRIHQEMLDICTGNFLDQRPEWFYTWIADWFNTIKQYWPFEVIPALLDEIDRLTKERDAAYAAANNAIYFSDGSDYLTALYDVCLALNPSASNYEIGNLFIDTNESGRSE